MYTPQTTNVCGVFLLYLLIFPVNNLICLHLKRDKAGLRFVSRRNDPVLRSVRLPAAIAVPLKPPNRSLESGASESHFFVRLPVGVLSDYYRFRPVAVRSASPSRHRLPLFPHQAAIVGTARLPLPAVLWQFSDWHG